MWMIEKNERRKEKNAGIFADAQIACHLVFCKDDFDGSIENSEPILPSQVSLKKEDLYSYCFEPPRGVIESAFQKDIHYDNIYNIINFNDVVPPLSP